MSEYEINQAIKTLECYLKSMQEDHYLSLLNEMRHELSIYDEKDRTIWITARIGVGVTTIDDQLESAYEQFAEELTIEVSDLYTNSDFYGVQAVEVFDIQIQSVEFENS